MVKVYSYKHRKYKQHQYNKTRKPEIFYCEICRSVYDFEGTIPEFPTYGLERKTCDKCKAG